MGNMTADMLYGVLAAFQDSGMELEIMEIRIVHELDVEADGDMSEAEIFRPTGAMHFAVADDGKSGSITLVVS